MCVVSMIQEHYKDKWGKPPYRWPQQDPYQWPNQDPYLSPPSESEESFKERLKKFMDEVNKQPADKGPVQKPISNEEIEEFRQLLTKAREYDQKNNQPDCGLEDKRKRLLELAEELGVGKQIRDVLDSIE